MWKDSVAAATVFSESGKRTFPFDDDGWGDPPATRAMVAPTTTASAGIALHANGNGSRGR